MKTRFFQAEMKEIEIKEGSIKIKGFASTPDIDRYNDIVNPKAFKNAIEGYMSNPIILLQHNSEKPIGKTVENKINKNGLNITVEITNDIDNVFKNIQDGILKGFSIGFIPKKWEYKMVGEKEIREITEIDLIEISVVSTPANPTSLFSLSKSIKSFFEEIDEANLITKNNIMVEEKVEEKTNEVIEEKEVLGENGVEEIDEESEEVIIEGTNIAPDEVEKASESLDTSEEVEEKTIENIVETETKAEENEAGCIKKEIEVMKQELKEQKELVNSLLDSMITLSNKTQEVKGLVDAMPIKRGLATLGGAETKTIDPFVQELINARDNA